MERTATDFATYFNGYEMPSLGRTLASFVVSFIAGFGMAWLADWTASILAIASVLVTGSTFIMWTVYFAVWAIAFVAMIYAGSALGRYVLDRHIDRDFAAAKDGVSHAWDSVTGFFKRSAKPAPITVH